MKIYSEKRKPYVVEDELELDTSATIVIYIPCVVHLKVVTINRRISDWDKYQVNDSRTIFST